MIFDKFKVPEPMECSRNYFRKTKITFPNSGTNLVRFPPADFLKSSNHKTTWDVAGSIIINLMIYFNNLF